MYNRTLANELKRLQDRLRAEHAAARVEREVEDAEAAEAKKRIKAKAAAKTKKEKGPFERRDDAAALADALARRTASAAAERDEAVAALEALEAAAETRGERRHETRGITRENLVAFLRACVSDLNELDEDEGSAASRRRRRVVDAALEGLRAEPGAGSGEKMLAAMFPQED